MRSVAVDLAVDTQFFVVDVVEHSRQTYLLLSRDLTYIAKD